MGNSKSMVIQGLCSEIRGVQSLSRHWVSCYRLDLFMYLVQLVSDYFYKLSWPGTVVVTLIFIPLGSLYNDVIWISGKVYVDYRIKRHTPLPVLYISLGN